MVKFIKQKFFVFNYDVNIFISILFYDNDV